MNPIYKTLDLTKTALSVVLSLKASVTSDGEKSEQNVDANILQSLKVALSIPNVTGERDLIASGECVLDGNELQIGLSNFDEGIYRLVVKAVFGTQTKVLYGLDIIVPESGLAEGTQEYEDTVVVVSTYGDGDKSGADAIVYAKDGDGNAHITKPLSIGDGVATGTGAVASGYAGEGASIQADAYGAVASGSADNDASIQATGTGAVASGCAFGEGAGIQATSDGAVASGYADGASIQATGTGTVASGSANGEGVRIQATSDGAVASGYAFGASIQATSEGAVASGYANNTYGNVEAQGVGSQAFGLGTQAAPDAQMVCGQCNVVDEDDTFQFIVGNGADNEHRRNAFAVTKSGELALFEADGTPVILTVADLKALIALVP